MSKQFYFKQLSLAYVRNLYVKTVPFQVIQFRISTHFSSWTNLNRYMNKAELHNITHSIHTEVYTINTGVFIHMFAIIIMVYIDLKIYIYIYIYIYMKKSRKNNLKKFNEFFMKADVECFGCNNLLHDFRFMKSDVKVAMDVRKNNKRKESV